MRRPSTVLAVAAMGRVLNLSGPLNDKPTARSYWAVIVSCPYRQAHRPAGETRVLDVIIDESAFDLRLKRHGIMAGQIRHLLALADSPHAMVRVIPRDAAFWEGRGHNFDVLSFAGTTDRICVIYCAVLGAELASGDLYDGWTRIENTLAADLPQSRAILERHLAALS